MTDITELAETLHANARAKGFYDHEDTLLQSIERSAEVAERLGASADFQDKHLRTQLAEHYGNRLLLIAGEAVEAHEEVRSGRGVAELYFSGEYDEMGNPIDSEWPVSSHDQSKLLKPEGVLAELADIAIRTLETMAGILAAASDEEKAKLRAQVPQNEATVVIADSNHNRSRTAELGPVNVGEVIILKHDYNLSRSHMNGGRKF